MTTSQTFSINYFVTLITETSSHWYIKLQIALNSTFHIFNKNRTRKQKSRGVSRQGFLSAFAALLFIMISSASRAQKLHDSSRSRTRQCQSDCCRSTLSASHPSASIISTPYTNPHLLNQLPLTTRFKFNPMLSTHLNIITIISKLKL
jgi:hypothetical protein